MTAARTHDDPAPSDFGRGCLVKTTQSVCPVCLEQIAADVRRRDGAIWMDKACTEHGRFAALLAADARHYHEDNGCSASSGGCCGPARHTGDQVANHSCNMLIEITDRCNLTCPTCYADSSPQRDEFMSLPRFEALLDDLIAKGKGSADLIQLSGGEPTLHPQMFDMIDAALDRGIARVYVNTNGIRFARREFAERFAALGSRVALYLQFDGVQRRSLKILRDREDLLETKLRVLELCNELEIDTVPVMTLAPNVNDGELGSLIDVAVAHDRAVRKIMIQPAMYSGRYEAPRVVERMTVADVAARIADQTGGLFAEEDFSPIPCSDPNCFSMALALRTTTGLLPVSRYFPAYATWGEAGVQELVAGLTDTFDDLEGLQRAIQWATGALAGVDESTVDALLDAVAQKRGVFAIGIKPFMDAFTYDQDRIDKCCVHVIARDGEPVSFCEYNAIRRPRGEG